MSDRLNIVYRPLTDIRPYERNPRDNAKAVDAVAASLQQFGFLVPIVIVSERDHTIVAGHTRYLAAQKLRLTEVPTVTADGLDENQIRAFRLVDNRTAEIAVWDLPLLDEAMEDIGDTIDMAQFGFTEGELYEPTNTSQEIDTDAFGDDAFDYECPECGFMFNEYQ